MGLDEILFNSEEESEEDEHDEDGGGQVSASYACEECDYRWDAISERRSDFHDAGEEDDVICPMCGSTYITQI